MCSIRRRPNLDARETPQRALAASVLAIIAALLDGPQATAQAMCQPALTVKGTSFSKPVNLQRIWRAQFDVDASRCTVSTGLFSLEIVRTMENGIDIAFVEPFVWQSGSTEVRVDFWHDETVHAFRVNEIAACPCRSN